MPRSFPEAEVAAATGAAPLRWEPTVGRGYARNNERWRIELSNGRRGFVKVALDDSAAEWLRTEFLLYSSVRGSFMPELLGWHDEGRTVLVIEDLSDAYWPPPWSDEQIAAVCAALDRLHAETPPDGLPSLADEREWLDGWPVVAEDPEPLVSTGVCSLAWLESALPELRRASAECELAGEALLHLDVRSDNLCFRDGDAMLVDWNFACVGDPMLDLVAWLPSLRLEGGPEPWTMIEETGGLASLICGFFAARAGLPPPPTAPTVRAVQRAQAEVALAWAARELDLPPPG